MRKFYYSCKYCGNIFYWAVPFETGGEHEDNCEALKLRKDDYSWGKKDNLVILRKLNSGMSEQEIVREFREEILNEK